MLTPTPQLYPNATQSLLVLFDLRDPEASGRMSRLREAFPEHSTVEALGSDLVVGSLFPGGARRVTS